MNGQSLLIIYGKQLLILVKVKWIDSTWAG